MRTELMGVPADALTEEQTKKQLYDFLEEPRRNAIIFSLNPEIVLEARKNETLRLSLGIADMLLTDGTGLVWALNRMGYSAERQTGADLLLNVLDWAELKRSEVFFAIHRDGLTKQKKLHSALQKRWPNLKFYISETTPAEEQIKHLDAEIVFANFGAPSQEEWIVKNKENFPNARILMTIGGGLDFVSGALPRAPELVRLISLEWLWRLAQQPRRIGRILNALIVFPFMVLLHGRKANKGVVE